MTTYEVEFLVPRAGHARGDRALMTCGAAERLALRGVVRIVQTILSGDYGPQRVVDNPKLPNVASEPPKAPPTPKRRGRPPKVK